MGARTGAEVGQEAATANNIPVAALLCWWIGRRIGFTVDRIPGTVPSRANHKVGPSQSQGWASGPSHAAKGHDEPNSASNHQADPCSSTNSQVDPCDAAKGQADPSSAAKGQTDPSSAFNQQPDPLSIQKVNIVLEWVQMYLFSELGVCP